MRCPTKIIRNDDVSADSTDIEWFSSLCDKYGFRAMQCITPFGETHDIDVRMTNEEIRLLSTKTIHHNPKLLEYLRGRDDIIAVHGLYHTHVPTDEEIRKAIQVLSFEGLVPTYFVPPFNEGDYGSEVCGLTVSAKTQRLEDYLTEGTPTDEIVYLHSWRFGSWYPREALEECLKRITTA